MIDISRQFQTPPPVCKYMASLIPEWAKTICEPTPGDGNLVREIEKRKKYTITAPADFFKMPKQQFDCIVMNPPFSRKYAFGVPENVDKAGMRLGYDILKQCIGMSNNIIALMPWFTITDSDVRLRQLKNFGLKSITALPRSTFEYIRIQTCVFELEKGFRDETKFKVFEQLKNNKIEIFQ